MYYFLDIDGVLNKESDWCKSYTINPSCLKVFKELLAYDKNPKIILSSTWRVNPEVLEPYFKIDGVTPISTTKTRQEEIDFFVRRYDIEDYIILDDDDSLFPEKEKIPLYLTNYKTGLVEDDIKKIRKLIKKR